MYDLKNVARNQPKESFPELLGGFIGNMILLGLYLAVPVLFILAALRVLGLI